MSFTVHITIILVCFDCTIRFAFVLQGVVTLIDTSGAKHKLEVLELNCNFDSYNCFLVKVSNDSYGLEIYCSYKPCTYKL